MEMEKLKISLNNRRRRQKTKAVNVVGKRTTLNETFAGLLTTCYMLLHMHSPSSYLYLDLTEP